MKTHYKFIYFIKVEDKPKTSVWHCLSQSTNDLLGEVKWYGSWRQYCFFPEPTTVFNVGCLEDINDFIGQLKKEKKGE